MISAQEAGTGVKPVAVHNGVVDINHSILLIRYGLKALLIHVNTYHVGLKVRMWAIEK